LSWGILAALVVVSLLAAFSLLRLDHARQLAQTKRAIFVYSSSSEADAAWAHSLRDKTGVAILDRNSAEGRAQLSQRRIAPKEDTAALMLPSSAGWIEVRSEKTIDDVLAPLSGVPTLHLRGAFAALTLAGLWCAFWVWRKSAAYLGAVWPILGIVALGVATPLCQGCLGGQGGLTPLAAAASLVGFGVVILLLKVGTPSGAAKLALLGFGAAFAGISQAALVLADPKFCIPCLLGGASWAGVFCVATTAWSERPLRAIFFGRKLAAVAAVAAGLLGARHVQAAATAYAPKPEKDFTSSLGKPLSNYFGSRHSKRAPGLYVVELAGCGTCDLAVSELRKRDVPFSLISFCRSGSSPDCFHADFSQVSPLFIVCDSSGRIAYAEAGWTQDDLARERFFERIRKWTSKENEPSIQNRQDPGGVAGASRLRLD
jgi:hypothetical protein